jgi:hypothetical protein
MKKPTIFISYASEDAAIAGVIETALSALSVELNHGIDIIRDIHTFKIGSSLKEQITEKLEISDILFIIYTKALKRSHSYTGVELGAFRVFMTQDKKQTGKTVRKVISFYLDEMPAPEQDILGIKLDIRSLGEKNREQRELMIDKDKGLSKVLYDITLSLA